VSPEERAKRAEAGRRGAAKRWENSRASQATPTALDQAEQAEDGSAGTIRLDGDLAGAASARVAEVGLADGLQLRGGGTMEIVRTRLTSTECDLAVDYRRQVVTASLKGTDLPTEIPLARVKYLHLAGD